MNVKKTLPNKPCPKCGHEDTVGHGYNLTKKLGNRARRKCKKCASTFYVENMEEK